MAPPIIPTIAAADHRKLFVLFSSSLMILAAFLFCCTSLCINAHETTTSSSSSNSSSSSPSSMITSSSSSPLDADLPPNYGDRRRPSEYEHARTTASSDRYGRRKREREDDEEEQYFKEGEDEEGSRGGQRFVLDRSVRVIKTEAGEMRVLPLSKSDGDDDDDKGSQVLLQNGVALGFLSLEPKALLLPHYTDTDNLFVVYKGRGRFSWIDGDELREMEMEEGDSYAIESGTVFHYENIDEGQRFQVFSIHDLSRKKKKKTSSSSYAPPHAHSQEEEEEEEDHDSDLQQQQTSFHRFFVAGGKDPKSVFSGFDKGLLATSFNVSSSEVEDVLRSQKEGPIVFPMALDSHDESESESEHRSRALENALSDAYKYIRLLRVFGEEKEYEPYNILKKSPDFSNDFGSTAAADENDFHLLKKVNKGIFTVKLKAGAVLAPHWNSRAMEIAIVRKGSGEIHVVYPNGSLAATEEVSEGMVFYIPKNYPMSQVASRRGPLEFIGFTTSSRPNRPQFLAGSNSVMRALKPDILASSFDIPVEHVREFFESQREAVILPGQAVEPEAAVPSKSKRKEEGRHR